MPLVQRQRLLIVITVGSTKFISLSQTIISQELVTLLSQRPDPRQIQVLIQIGNQELRQEGLLSKTPNENISQFNHDSLSHLKLRPTANIELVIFKYSDKIDQLISQAQLVITHAGKSVIFQKMGTRTKFTHSSYQAQAQSCQPSSQRPSADQQQQ